MSGRYTSQAHQRDRTALFGNAQGSYGRPVTPTNNSISGNATPYRAATPNSKGQFSAQVYDDLESQNDQQLEGLFGKVRMLKDVTNKIGDHINSDNQFLGEMEETFSNAGTRLKGTYSRMMRMAERSGVGWRAWLIVFALIFLVFFYVWWR